MNLVVDANVVAALVLPLPYSDRATQRFVDWKRDGMQLNAPLLLEYEVVSVLRKAVVAGMIDSETTAETVRRILALNVRCLPPTAELHLRALRWAERLGQSVAYDAQYLALAEHQQAELWTADRRLVESARQAGLSWVRWIGEGGG
jgi:predicted nucleic acid-binding protein